MTPDISVIICSYNPAEYVFSKCLAHIVQANKGCPVKEILLIDNNSSPALVSQEYIKEFLKNVPNARVVVEKKQGLTPARLRGIEESAGDLLVFIDDDNYIAPDFFEKGSVLALANPHIGSWSGQVRLMFESEPEPWMTPYHGLLVHREFYKDVWSNSPHWTETMPCGAGLFVRRAVAKFYVDLHHGGKREIQLDRSGNSLFSGGDNDLAACACDIGMGVGLFHELVLDHYIPSSRLTKKYLLKLAEGITASSVVFRSFRGEYPRPLSLKNRLANYLRVFLKNPIDREFFKAVIKGEESGRQMVKNS